MRRFWHRCVASLTDGVRVMLFAMVAMYFAALVGKISRTYDLTAWVGLNPNAFWSGRVWTVVTYPLLPAGVGDLVINLVLVGWLGPRVEAEWSKWELWTYCLLTTAASGAAKLLLARFDGTMMIGAMPIVYGLMVAWMRLRGHERMQAWMLGETTAQMMGVVMLTVSAVALCLGAGWVDAAIVLAAALCGWVYLSVRWRWNREQAGQPVESQRMRRLEL